ncbi:MAG: hypothetical protein JW839_13595 [Candidatus Lokiarchaeota archaeon]|nr:hypothetical protein [Candidatus Lokiarchaeota archaeon]
MLLRNGRTPDRATSTRFLMAGLSCMMIILAIDAISPVLPPLALVKGVLGGLSATLSAAGLVFYGRWYRSRDRPPSPAPAPCW